MPTRSSRPRDINQIAKAILDEATGEAPKTVPPELQTGKQAAGRKGGTIGGKSRMGSLSTEERAELAKRAAAARWNKAPALQTGAPEKLDKKRTSGG